MCLNSGSIPTSHRLGDLQLPSSQEVLQIFLSLPPNVCSTQMLFELWFYPLWPGVYVVSALANPQLLPSSNLWLLPLASCIQKEAYHPFQKRWSSSRMWHCLIITLFCGGGVDSELSSLALTTYPPHSQTSSVSLLLQLPASVMVNPGISSPFWEDRRMEIWASGLGLQHSPPGTSQLSSPGGQYRSRAGLFLNLGEMGHFGRPTHQVSPQTASATPLPGHVHSSSSLQHCVQTFPQLFLQGFCLHKLRRLLPSQIGWLGMVWWGRVPHSGGS